MASILPPRKKDWTKGEHQIGLFIRTPDGSTMQFSRDKATPEMVRLAAELLFEVFAPGELAKIREEDAKRPTRFDMVGKESDDE